MCELRAFDVDHVLPSEGLLYFFFNKTRYAWGTEPEDRDRFRVLYASQTSNLKRQSFPDSIVADNRVERVRRVRPFWYWQLPTADPLAQAQANYDKEGTWGEPATDPFTIQYWDIKHALTRPYYPLGNHQLLGWANGIFEQGEDCRLLCEIARRGFPKQGTNDFENAIAERSHWRCLLEIGDDWRHFDGTWGSIAFMIRHEDLVRRRFESSWCVVSAS